MSKAFKSPSTELLISAARLFSSGISFWFQIYYIFFIVYSVLSGFLVLFSVCVFHLSFIWSKIRTEAQETAPHIALRNCSKEAEMGKGQYTCDFGEGGIRAVKHICFQKVSASLVKLVLVTRNSHHHEGF